jgi:hypothetical protein
MIRRDRRRGNGGGDWDAAIKSLGETLIKVLFGRWSSGGIMNIMRRPRKTFERDENRGSEENGATWPDIGNTYNINGHSAAGESI